MIQGFKDFITRGNVVELAIAVVIGTAFATVIDSFVSGIVQPIINLVGSPDVGLGFDLRPGSAGGVESPTYLNLGAVITALITFLITALVIYFVFVLPLNKFEERRKAKLGEVEQEAEPTEAELLKEIRDLLKAQQNSPGA